MKKLSFLFLIFSACQPRTSDTVDSFSEEYGLHNEDFINTYDSLKSVLITDTLDGTFMEGMKDSTFRGVVALNSRSSAFHSTDTIKSTLAQLYQMEVLFIMGGKSLLPKNSILDPDTGCTSAFLEKMMNIVHDSFDVVLESKFLDLMNGNASQDGGSARGIYIYIRFDSSGHSNPGNISIISNGNVETNRELNTFIYTAIYTGIKNHVFDNCGSNFPAILLIPFTLPASEIKESEMVRKRAIENALREY